MFIIHIPEWLSLIIVMLMYLIGNGYPTPKFFWHGEQSCVTGAKTSFITIL